MEEAHLAPEREGVEYMPFPCRASRHYGHCLGSPFNLWKCDPLVVVTHPKVLPCERFSVGRPKPSSVIHEHFDEIFLIYKDLMTYTGSEYRAVFVPILYSCSMNSRVQLNKDLPL